MQADDERNRLRTSVTRGRPFGDDADRVARRCRDLGLAFTPRPPGRPRMHGGGADNVGLAGG